MKGEIVAEVFQDDRLGHAQPVTRRPQTPAKLGPVMWRPGANEWQARQLRDAAAPPDLALIGGALTAGAGQ